jgi:hypothetical protein
VGLAADRHLTLLHDLEERALHLCGRAVDLIGQEQVGEDRSERGLELAVLLVVDAGADKVRRDEVWRELDPLELAADRLRDGLDRERLRQAGNALNKEMTASKQRDDHALEQVVLADDDLLDLEEQALHLAAGSDTRCHGVPSFYSGGMPSPAPAASMVTANPTPLKTLPAGLTSPVTIPTTSPF